MLISPSKKILFFAVPKTGTRSVYKVLRETYKDSHKLEEHGTVVPITCLNYFSFIIKRNPYDRALATYWSAIKNGWQDIQSRNPHMSFAEFMMADNPKFQMLLRPQHIWYKNRVDAVIDFEAIQEGYNQLPFVNVAIKMPDLNSTRTGIHGMDKLDQSPRPPWWDYLSPSDIALINYKYARDFTLLGYDKV
jgi:hypothetical protein